MTARHLLAIGAAAGALVSAGPAFAQTGPAPQSPYEFAEPAPPAPPAPPPVIYHDNAVVQPIPAPAPPAAEYYTDEYEYVEEAPTPPVVHHAPPPVIHHAGPAAYPAPAPHAMHHSAPVAHGYPAGHYPQPAYPGAPYPQHAGWAPPPQWDRDAWLADCRDRTRGADRRERGGIIGGLLGAIGGGVAGNRIADGERLAGTLIGAGVGGLAGLAIGTAIGAVAGRERADECELYLDRYLSGPAYGHPGYGYGYAYPAYTMTYVPVTVAVPQRAVVREYVTTEWVDVPQTTRTVVETKIIRQPAPTKRVKTIKRAK